MFTLPTTTPYRTDLAPSDYHMFGPLIEALGGRSSATHEGVKDAVHTWLRSQQKNFLADWIGRFANRYTIYVEKSVDYIEQLHTLT